MMCKKYMLGTKAGDIITWQGKKLQACRLGRHNVLPHTSARHGALPHAKGKAEGMTDVFKRAVIPVPIKVITVVKGNSSAAAAMADEWLQKARRYTQVIEVLVKPNPKKASSPDVQMRTEGEKVLKSIAPGDKLVVLDERGRAVKSEDVARLIAEAGDDSSQAIVFCIGGPYGHSNLVRERADAVISLSSLVLNHQVAHIVLCEQIYRGWTILRGEPYQH